jgi:hypothetical protein
MRVFVFRSGSFDVWDVTRRLGTIGSDVSRTLYCSHFPSFQSSSLFSGTSTSEDGTSILCRNIGKQMPLVWGHIPEGQSVVKLVDGSFCELTTLLRELKVCTQKSCVDKM